MKVHKILVTTFSLVLTILYPLPGSSMPSTGETVIQRDNVDDDYYAAGGTIDINALVSGDVVIAGGDLFAGHHIKGDVIAAGGSVHLRGDIQDDVRTAGGDIMIDANIGDDLIAGGGRINVSAGSVIGGEAWLAGGDVHFAGTVDNDLMIGAGSTRISGVIHGDVNIESGEINILQGAVIDGDLNYRSPQEAVINSTAQIHGKITYEQVDWDRSHRGSGIFFVVTMIAAAFALYKLFPGFTISAVSRISDDPLKSMGAGIIVLIIIPFAAALLMGIVIGVWISLSIIALYLVVLLVSFLVSCYFVGDWTARRFNKDVSTSGRRYISVALAILVLGFLKCIPVAGGLLIFVLLLSGLGAVTMQLKQSYDRSADR